MITRTASAAWTNGIKDGSGTLSSESGVLDETPYSFHTRFEDQPGTNPEELIGAAHAGCYSMALSKVLGDGGMTPERIDTRATVYLDMEGGPSISRVHLETKIRAAGDEADILAAAEAAKDGCPVSKVLKAEITLDASVV